VRVPPDPGYNPLVIAAGIAIDKKNRLMPLAPWT
jgi:hypothetical protein